MGIEPTPSAWKAEVLPLNYTRPTNPTIRLSRKPLRQPRCLSAARHRNTGDVVEGEGFEPSKA